MNVFQLSIVALTVIFLEYAKFLTKTKPIKELLLELNLKLSIIIGLSPWNFAKFKQVGSCGTSFFNTSQYSSSKYSSSSSSSDEFGESKSHWAGLKTGELVGEFSVETAAGFSVLRKNLTFSNLVANLTDLALGIEFDLIKDGNFRDDFMISPDFFLSICCGLITSNSVSDDESDEDGFGAARGTPLIVDTETIDAAPTGW
ncbi:unnamed protein product [Ambrosiozyma monospora]|uniref:Unnamed protein product n=1 Tax=Ambrosiozyma monospora TaxID=43982 RepID=A0ACB5U251_AMBMO|nr:unnamed protein product [Ambrosiozyma monospora]